MKDSADSQSSGPLLFRVLPDPSGKIYMSWDEFADFSVEVERPVDKEILLEAQARLIKHIRSELSKRDTESGIAEDRKKKTTEAQQKAQDEIDEALYPWRGGPLQLAIYFIERSFKILLWVSLSLFFISLTYKGIQTAYERLPEELYLLVLLIYVAALIFAMSLIMTEKSRWKWRDKIRLWLGPRGGIVFPLLILVAAVSVFATFTMFLYSHEWISLTDPTGKEVTSYALMDFYMWHFFELIPFLDINHLIRWDEQILYSQSRVGFLVLLFQGFVVIPSTAAMRFFWKHRHELARNKLTFVTGERKPSENS